MELMQVSKSGFLRAIEEGMSEARADERMRIANLVEDMIHEDLPGGYIVLLRQVRDKIISGGN
jgi:hypothetical protein